MDRDRLFASLPTLETDRLVLRPVQERDAADVYECCSDPLVAKFMQWEPHQSLEQSREVVAELVEKYRTGSNAPWGIVLRDEGTLVGTINLGWWPSRHNVADVAYVINRSYWNRGLVTEALRAVLRLCFTDTTLNRVHALVEHENVASWRVLEKAGMRLEGVMREYMFYKGRYHDLSMYSILRRDWSP